MPFYIEYLSNSSYVIFMINLNLQVSLPANHVVRLRYSVADHSLTVRRSPRRLTTVSRRSPQRLAIRRSPQRPAANHLVSSSPQYSISHKLSNKLN